MRNPGCDDRDPRGKSAAAGFGKPKRAIAAKASYISAEDRFDAEARGVAFKIVDDLRARGIERILARHRHARQAGMTAVGVEMKAIVMTSPHGAYGIGLLQ